MIKASLLYGSIKSVAPTMKKMAKALANIPSNATA